MYMLPQSAAEEVSEIEAERFLERLWGKPKQLAIARAACTLAPRAAALLGFVRGPLRDLVRGLPAQARVTKRIWEHGFRGRLDVAATLACWLQGRKTTFVTRDRYRTFDLPENILLKATLETVLAEVERLRTARALPEVLWGGELRATEGTLRHLLHTTVLREVSSERPSTQHLQAARAARHPAYRIAAVLWENLDDGLHTRDPKRIARILSEGALLPCEHYTRFELAVVTRLIEAVLEMTKASADRWTIEYSLILPNRADILSVTRADGLTVRVYYNQSVLPMGAADLDARHYLDLKARLRPDATVSVERDGKRLMAFIVECKCSNDIGYVQQGLQEARLYRWEYAPELTGWPKAILVASSSLRGAVRSGDDVIGIHWNDWVPASVVAEFSAQLGRL
jgi:hypothetical protein